MTEEKEQKHKKKDHHKENAAEELQKENQGLLKEKQELFEKLQRLSADYANFQKRVPKQLADSVAYEKDKMVKAILPVMDNFEHTLKVADTAENTATLAKGIKIIYDQLMAALKSMGVEQIKGAGEKFDPTQHQAIMQQADPEKEDDTVLEEFQVGYKLDGRIIRPSRVKVNKLPQNEQPVEEKESFEELAEDGKTTTEETKEQE